MPAVAQLRSAQEVLNWYNAQDENAWELYRFAVAAKNRQNLFYGKDKADGATKLQSELMSIQPDDSENYVIVLGVVKGAKEKTFEPLISKVFVVNEKPYGVMAGMVQPVYSRQNDLNAEILNEIRALRAERLAEAEAEAEDEIEEEEAQTPGSILAGMMNTPQFQTIVFNLLQGLAGNLMQPKVQHVAGTMDIEQILQTLYRKGVTPDDLAKLAAMPESQITMLLSMLRK